MMRAKKIKGAFVSAVSVIGIDEALRAHNKVLSTDKLGLFSLSSSVVLFCFFDKDK